MKNISKLFIIVVMMTLLVGCGKVATLKDGEQKIAGTKDDNFSSNQLYDAMIEKYGAEAFVDMLDTSIFNKMYSETDDEKEYIKSQLKDLEESAKQNKTSYEDLIKYYGFENEKALKEYMSLNYRRDKAVNNYISKDIKDSEIKDYYDSDIYGDIKVKHILIGVTTDDKDSDKEKTEKESKAKKTAEEVIEKLKKGEKFEDLAKKYSTDTATAKKGGDLGWVAHGDMVTEFDTAAFGLEKGKYTTSPIKTTYGYHVILKEDQKEKPKLEKVKSTILDALVKQKLSSDSTLYYTALDGIRKDAGLKFEDSKLKKLYNKYVQDQKDKAKQSATNATTNS